MFTRVGSTQDVAVGEIRAYRVDGTSITVANVGGRLYEFDATCTHMGCSLAMGTLDGTT